jgi:tRNA 5-methylaminomethyl-2-thiouridine biosynthesis bifunctional protein
VAGGVRRALAAQGFALEKIPGLNGKREMLTGTNRSRKPRRYHMPPMERRQAIVIGAGVAGSAAAFALASRKWQVTVLERQQAAGMGASGNLAGVMRPLPSRDDNFLARLTRAGFLAARAHFSALGAAGLPVRWEGKGALHLARDEAQEATQAIISHDFPPDFLRFLGREAASQWLGHPTCHGGWFFPMGGWAQPFSLCQAHLMAAPERIHTRFAAPVGDIASLPKAEGWQVFSPEGVLLATAPVLIIASGVAASRSPFARWLNDLPQKTARGQVTWLPASQLPRLAGLVCGQGYLTPAVGEALVTGASFQVREEDDDDALCSADQAENLARLARLLPGFLDSFPAAADMKLQGRVGFRPMSPDRLPIVGAVPCSASRNRSYPTMRPGLFCLQGYGSRGIVWAALMADLLASIIDGEPLPLECELVRAVAPERFLPRP